MGPPANSGCNGPTAAASYQTETSRMHHDSTPGQPHPTPSEPAGSCCAHGAHSEKGERPSHAAEKHEQAQGAGAEPRTAATTLGTDPVYTCPMHPEVRENHPGTCPKCGMALEL